ncbi:Ppx/GppA phosphatase family protein [Guggenheimella bovis]
MANHVFAGIDIGSNAIKMKIVQTDLRTISVLEDLSKTVYLGEEAFTTNQLVILRPVLMDTLKYFSRLLKEYKVEKYLAVATNPFRLANNRAFLQDEIERAYGIKVQIIDDAQEKFITYKSLRDQEKNYLMYRKEGTVLVELTSGGCDVTFYRDDKLIRNDEIGIGSLELREILEAFQEMSNDSAEMLEQYIATKVDYIGKVLKNKTIRHYLAMGGEMTTLTRAFFHGSRSISREEFYSTFKRLTSNLEELKVASLKADKDWQEVLASLVFFKVFFDLLHCDKLVIPDISLRSGLISELIDGASESSRYHSFNEDPFNASYQVAKRFGVHTAHAKFLEKNGTLIWNALKDAYESKKEELVLLRHAAFLHEIGKSIDLNDYYEASSKMISGLRIFNLNNQEVQRISEICLILGRFIKKDVSVYSSNLDDLRIAAILHLVDSFDASKWEHIKIQEVDLKKNHLTIRYEGEGNMVLEEMMLRNAQTIFSKIFGLTLRMEEVQ